MSSRLDEVADRLATRLLTFRPGPKRLLDFAPKRWGALGILAALVVVMAVTVAWLLRQLFGVTVGRTTRRLYEQATGVGRDRTRADLSLVLDRLIMLKVALDAPAMRRLIEVGPTVEFASNGPQGEALLHAASRRLVAWVAAGRTGDELSDVEAAFARTIQITPTRKGSSAAELDALESYADAWIEVLGPAG
jgi:hypothetical protein